MDTLVVWWRENALPFGLGSVAWTAVAWSAQRLLRGPLWRQRIAETAIAGWSLWFALGLLPGRAGDPAVAARGVAQVLGTGAPTAATADGVGATWATLIDGLGLLWLGGMLVCGCQLMLAMVLLHRVLQRSTGAPDMVQAVLGTLPHRPRGLRLVVSDLAWRPFCCGLLRPHVVLPASMCRPGAASERQLRAVLLHEFAHLGRGDLRGRCLFAAAMPFLWWNPLFWALRRSAHDAAELLADEVAARDHRDRAGYARSLIDLAEQLPAAREGRVAALGVFGPRVQFCERMTMLLRRQSPLTTRCSRRQTALRCVAAIALAIGSAACWTAPRPATPQEPPAATGTSAPSPRTYFAFRDTDVVKVIDAIAKIGGANIVVAQGVQGNVTLQCKNVPWREALDTAVAQVGAHVTDEGHNLLRVSR